MRWSLSRLVRSGEVGAPRTSTENDPAIVRALLTEARDRGASPSLRRLTELLLAYGPEKCKMFARVCEPGSVLQAYPDAHERQDGWFLARGTALVTDRSAAGRGLAVFSVGPGHGGGQHPCEPPVAWPPPVHSFARAVSACTAVVLGHAEARALMADPELARALSIAERFRRLAPIAVATVRRADAFRLASHGCVLDLLLGGEAITLAEGTVLTTTGEVPDRALLLLEGVVESARPGVRATLGPGEIVGFGPFLARAPALETVTTKGPCTGLSLTLTQLRRCYGAHARAVRDATTPIPADTAATVLLLSGEDDPGQRLAAAAVRSVAAYLATEFNDLALLVRLTGGAGPPTCAAGIAGVATLTLPIGTGDIRGPVCDALARLEAQTGRSNRIVLLEPDVDPALLVRAAHAIETVFSLTSDPGQEPPAGFERCRHHVVGLLAESRARTARIWPVGSIRVRLHSAAVIANQGRAAWACADPAAGGVRRIGRAMTERLVGIALGGGGVPGFAHVALLRALRSRAPAMPIDVIAGSSVGSLVGAWYAGMLARPLPETELLQSLLDDGDTVNGLLMAAMVTSLPVTWWVDRVFGDVQLGELEVPFFGVCTDILSGTSWMDQDGSLGGAVRISSAFPPAFPALPRPGARFVDGGFGDNVPVTMLRALGASFVIGSNALGVQNTAPTDERPGGPLRRVLQELNPLRRIGDAVRASMVLFHRLGDYECQKADLAFDACFSGTNLWNFGRGDDVVAATMHDAEAFADNAAVVWKRWSAPMPDEARLLKS